MEKAKSIVGKVLVFTDLHLGLSNNSVSKLKIAIKAVEEIIKYIKDNNVKEVLFLGDWNHSRVTTENNVLNVSYKLMTALQKYAHVRMIIGNHDTYMKNSIDINSLVIFRDLPEVEVICKNEVLEINGKQALLTPWLGDLTAFKKEQFDMLFGHFDVSAKYLIQAYVEDHSNKLRAACQQSSAGDLVGDFVEIVKRDTGVVFSGHIHGRREFNSKGRKFIFVGSPYQQNLGEIENLCGFYILNEDMTYDFHEIKSTPKHIKVKMSEAVSSDDMFDFSIAKGNIIQKVYDVEVDRVTEAKISQKISDMMPYEELLPEYDIEIASQVSSDTSQDTSTVEVLKKSKLEYIYNYVQNISDDALKNDGLDKERLYETLEKYYSAVAS